MSILKRICNMGSNPITTVEEIDHFVDLCLEFLKRQQCEDPELNLSNDIFEIEAARQHAMQLKFEFFIR